MGAGPKVLGIGMGVSGSAFTDEGSGFSVEALEYVERLCHFGFFLGYV